jgi:hypothetical protein
MSIDRIHDVSGLMQFSAQPVINSTGTASTIASNQLEGGYQFGAYVGIAPAGTASVGGGAHIESPYPRGVSSTVQAFATTGMITHDNAGLVLVSVSTTGIALNLQPAAYNGQMLTLAVIPGTTASIVSTVVTTGVGGTTTAACAVLDQAYTFASTACPVFVGLAKLGGTATTNVPFVWRRVV